MKRYMLFPLILVLVLALVGCSFSDGTSYEETNGDWIEVELNKTNDIQTLDSNENFHEYYEFKLEHSEGDIEVSTWEKDKIGFRIIKKAYGESPKTILEKTDLNYDWAENDYTLEVETIVPDDLEYDEEVTVEFQIKFPETIRVDLYSESSNGDINISKIIGNVEAHTSNGDIKIKDIDTETTLYAETSNGDISVEDITAEKVEIHTSNGNIVANNIKYNLIAETSNGSISVDDVEGELTAQNSDGAITLSNIRLAGDADIESSDGNISLELLQVKEGEYSIESSDGNIDVLFPSDIKLELELSGKENNFDSNFLEFPEGKNDFNLKYPDGEDEYNIFFGIETDGEIILNKAD